MRCIRVPWSDLGKVNRPPVEKKVLAIAAGAAAPNVRLGDVSASGTKIASKMMQHASSTRRAVIHQDVKVRESNRSDLKE